MRFACIAAKKAEHTVTILCRCMRVTRSGFYAWCGRKVSAHTQEDARLRVKVRAFFEASHGRDGSPRIWEDLVEDGQRVSRKRVIRLMQEGGLQGRAPTRFTATTITTIQSRPICSTRSS